MNLCRVLDKQRVRTSISYLTKLLPVRQWVRLTGRPLVLPFYHAVSDQTRPHLEGLYRYPDIDSFKRDLDWLCRNFQPVDLPEVIAFSKGQKHFEQAVFHLTFDDGLRECAEIIAPILRARKLPATFLVNPAFVENGDMLYRMKQTLLCSPRDASNTQQPVNNEQIWATSFKEQHRLDEWAARSGFSFRDYLQNQKPYMSWKQLRELKGQGFHIGAHSMHHPPFQQLTQTEMKAETGNSLKALEQAGVLTYRIFAFPFSDVGIAEKDLVELQSSLNIDLMLGSSLLKKERHAGHLQRIPIETPPYRADGCVSYAWFNYFWHTLKGTRFMSRS